MRTNQDYEGWTTVRYGRRRRRNFSPPPPRYNRDTCPEVRSDGYRRSYASVTRGPRKQQTATYSTSRSRQWSTRPQQYTRCNWNPSDQFSRSIQQFYRNQNSRSTYRSRDRANTDRVVAHAEDRATRDPGTASWKHLSPAL